MSGPQGNLPEEKLTETAWELGREPSVPIPCELHRNGDYGPRDSYGGLTKRELFAAMAMQGLWSAPRQLGSPERVAKDAVECADALLKELAK